MFIPEDHIHTTKEGAIINAELVVEAIHHLKKRSTKGVYSGKSKIAYCGEVFVTNPKLTF